MNQYNIRIYIDPRCIITYSSFYIQGLYDFFGKKNVEFSNKYFHEVNMRNKEYTHINDSLMLIIAIDASSNNVLLKLAIDFRDTTSIIDNAYSWCDIYAKINYNKVETLRHKNNEKILSIPPSFAIRYTSVIGIIYDMIHNVCKVFISKHRAPSIFSIKTFIINYIYLILRRKPLSAYTKHVKHRSNYVFFISTLWEHLNCVESTNILRAKYMRTCKQNPDIVFEGGFYIKNNNEYAHQYNDLKLKHHIPIIEYINKTKQSKFVFNTPSCWNCHGWKLGEFLAMGKAIISSPITNELPEQLINGYHIHIVCKPDDIQTAVELMQSDDKYRQSLEIHARQYFETYATPYKVIEFIFARILDKKKHINHITNTNK